MPIARPPPRIDALRALSTYRTVLRQNQLTSLEAYRAATEAGLAALDGHRAPIARLVQEGDPDVFDALFGPVEWTCVEYGFPLGGRGLTIHWTVG